MRRMTRFVPLLALGLTLSFAGACKTASTRDGKSPTTDRKSKREPELVLPDPLPLPEHPKVASFIAQPKLLIGLVEPYSPAPIDAYAAAEQALMAVTEPGLANDIAGAIDLTAPFANVILDDGQEVIRLSIRAEAREVLGKQLGELAKVGEFGAVTLPPTQYDFGGEVKSWLAWIDEADGGALVLANSLEGLVTGRTLAAAYGKLPVYFAVDPSALPIEVDVPFARVTGRGDLSNIIITAEARAGENPFAELPIASGTLSNLLGHNLISAGASTRYADYKDAVRDVIVEVNAAVSQLPFLVKGVGEGIAAKLATALRTWDGRVLVAMGPENHIRLAYGAADVEKSRVATLRLLQAVVDNVSMARNFSSRIPKMALKRKVAKAGGEDIEVFVLHEAFSMAPELRPLVDKESRLNVAMAWSERAGGGMIVIGPNAATELGTWLERTSSGEPSTTTEGQLLAASFAADPDQLKPLLANPDPNGLGLEQLVSLAATGPRWHVTVDDQGAGKYTINVMTPHKPARQTAQ